MTAAPVSTGVAQSRVGAETRAQYIREGWWREQTFLDDLQSHARTKPHKLAIVGRRIAQSRTDTLDYAELAELTDRFALALLDLGVRRGDFVAVQLPNRWEWPPLIFACARVGAVICPISPICPEAELRHRLGLTRARVFVTVPQWADTRPAEIGVRLQNELDSLVHVITVDGPVPEGACSFHAQFAAAEYEPGRTAELAGLSLGPDEPFVVLFTSGTTGESKGVLHSQNTIHSAIRGYVDAYGLGEEWVAAVSTPLVHYSGFAQGILAGVLLGGTIAFQDIRRNEALLDLVERYGATLLYGPPATLADVADSQEADKRGTDTLRHVVIGSGPVLPELAERVHAALGARAYSLWGMSEVGPVTMTRPSDPQDWAAHGNGGPIPSMHTRIVRDAAVGGGVGRLQVRGASLALGYYRREEVFAAEITEDGWFDTGDLARDDGRGGIRIVGRTRDAIVRDGLIAPMVELEALIGSHPALLEAALVELRPDPGGNGSICAVVVPYGGAETPSLEQIRALLRAAGQDERFQPDRIEALPALPKTLTGKIRKVELRERFTVPEH